MMPQWSWTWTRLRLQECRIFTLFYSEYNVMEVSLMLICSFGQIFQQNIITLKHFFFILLFIFLIIFGIWINVKLRVLLSIHTLDWLAFCVKASQIISKWLFYDYINYFYIMIIKTSQIYSKHWQIRFPRNVLDNWN